MTTTTKVRMLRGFFGAVKTMEQFDESCSGSHLSFAWAFLQARNLAFVLAYVSAKLGLSAYLRASAGTAKTDPIGHSPKSFSFHAGRGAKESLPTQG